MSKIPSIHFQPLVYKANKLMCSLPTNGDADLDFARVGEATRTNPLGLNEVVATGVPRSDNSDGGCPSLLVEPASTNLITYSEDFSNANWNKDGTCTVTDNNGVSPTGAVNASLLQDATGDTFVNSIRFGLSVSNSTDYTATVYANLLNSTTARLSVYDNQTTLTTFTLSQSVSGWQRIEVPFTTGVSTTGINVSIGLTDSDILIYGAQLEEQSYATSYIPTTGTTATRVAETVSKTGLGDYINSSEGVFCFEAKALANSSNFRELSISDGTSNNRITILFDSSNRLSWSIVSGGSVVLNQSKVTDITIYNKIAVSYSNASTKVYINGAEESSSTSLTMPTGLDRMQFGTGNNPSAAVFLAETKDLRVYNQAQTDLELEALTGFGSFNEMKSYLNYN